MERADTHRDGKELRELLFRHQVFRVAEDGRLSLRDEQGLRRKRQGVRGEVRVENAAEPPVGKLLDNVEHHALIAKVKVALGLVENEKLRFLADRPG